MDDLSALEFTNKDIITLIIRAKGIREGHWVLAAKLHFVAASIGFPPDNESLPSGIVALAGVKIERAPEPLPNSVNAAEVNPHNDK